MGIRNFKNYPELQQILIDCNLEYIIFCDSQTFRKKLKSIFDIELSVFGTADYYYVRYKLENYKKFINNLKKL